MKLHAGTREAVVLVFLGLALLFVITNSSANAYRSERLRLAESHYKSGEDLAKAGQPAKAVEEFRAALLYSHDDPQYELALSVSLMDLGRLDEAQAHLRDLHDSDPNNALIDELLARIAAREGRTDEAVALYNQAIYGLWPEHPAQNRLQARFDLVHLLARTGQSRQALSELLALSDEAPSDPALQDRIGSLLLQYGSPDHAAQVFGSVLDNDPSNAVAAFGLGEAMFAQANYSAAEGWYRKAARLDPKNVEAQRRLQETAEIRSLDPTLVSLSASGRYERARTLVEKTLASLQECTAGSAPTADTSALIANAQQFLHMRRRHREGDTPMAISLAEQLWQTRKQVCGAPPASEEALDLVMAKVAN